MQTLLEIGLSNALMATLLAVLAITISRICQRPALTHGLWLLVLLKLVTPPIYAVSVPWPARGDAPPTVISQGPVASSPTPQDGSFSNEDTGSELWIIERVAPRDNGYVFEEAPAHATSTVSLSWTQVLAPVWVVGSLFWFAWLGAQVFRFRRALTLARPAPATIQDQARALAGRLGLDEYPAVWLMPGIVSPMLWSVGGQSRVLFPKKLLDLLDRDQRGALLMHELAHWRRRDHWVRFLEVIVLGLYWWHPVVWWARRELREAEEQCCDAWVVSTLAADRVYATAILQTVAFLSQSRCTLPIPASGIGQVPELRRRITMIMQGGTPRSLSWAGFTGLVALGLLSLPLVPLRAQDKPNSPVDEQIGQLKKKLKALEEMQSAEKQKKGADGEVQRAQAEEAKMLVAKCTKIVDLKRKELEEANAKLREARARLAKLTGHKFVDVTGGADVEYELQRADGDKSGNGVKVWRVTPGKEGQPLWAEGKKSSDDVKIWRVMPGKEGQPFVIKTAPDEAVRTVKPGEKPKVEYRLWKKEAEPATPADKQQFEYRFFKEAEPGGANQKAEKPRFLNEKSSDNRSADLEKRLNQLMKELDELKRELRRGGSDKQQQ
jgi:bla regulator protein blaR1